MLIDTHCHLDFPDFADDLPGLIERARAAGVERMVTISTRVARFGAYADLAERFPAIWCTVGTHPHQAHEELDVTAERLVELAQHPRCVAIGEAGLDYHYDKSPREAQRQGLLTHIEAARRSQLPLVIHAREADDDMAKLLREEHARGPFQAILHCFTAGEALAMTGVELGFYVSFSGILTFKTSIELRRIATLVPRERLLVETDAPYLAPVPYRGKRNEPAFVAETAKVLADALGKPYEAIVVQTGENARRCYWKMDASAAAARVA